MNTIVEFMSTDHRACDLAFATAEQAALTNSLHEAETAFDTFRQNIQRHFRMEEEMLFPALLDAGGPGGPVQIMRMEHAQMNELIELMATAIANENTRGYSGLSETLLIVMQQHNLKEEQILYPIADRILAAELETLFSRMHAIQ